MKCEISKVVLDDGSSRFTLTLITENNDDKNILSDMYALSVLSDVDCRTIARKEVLTGNIFLDGR